MESAELVAWKASHATAIQLSIGSIPTRLLADPAPEFYLKEKPVERLLSRCSPLWTGTPEPDSDRAKAPRGQGGKVARVASG